MAYLIGRAFHWFGGRASARARRTPVYLDDHTLRDIGFTRMEYHFLHMSDPASARDAGGADQAKRPIAPCWQQPSRRSAGGFNVRLRQWRLSGANRRTASKTAGIFTTGRLLLPKSEG